MSLKWYAVVFVVGFVAGVMVLSKVIAVQQQRMIEKKEEEQKEVQD